MESKIKVTNFEEDRSPYLARYRCEPSEDRLIIVLVNQVEFDDAGYATVVYSDNPNYSLGEIIEAYISELTTFHEEITLIN